MKKIFLLITLFSLTIAQTFAAVVNPGTLLVTYGATTITNGATIDFGTNTSGVIKIDNSKTTTSTLTGTVSGGSYVTSLSSTSFSLNKNQTKNFTVNLDARPSSSTRTATVSITSNDVNITFNITYSVPCNIAKVTSTVSNCGSYVWLGDTYTESGTYTKSYTSKYGCDSVVELALTVNPILTPLVSLTNNAVSNTINDGDNVTFTASTTNAGTTPTFTWYKNNVKITGNSTNTYSSSTLANNDLIEVTATASVDAGTCLTTQTTSRAANGIIVIKNLIVNGNQTIRGNYTNVTINSGRASLNGNLVISGKLLIKSGGSIELNSTRKVTANIVELEDDAIVYETGNNGTSNLTAPTIIYNRTEGHGGYTYIGSPLTNATGVKGYEYDEVNRNTTDYASGWKVASGTFVVGKGYAINGLGAIQLTGNKLNNGPITVNATNTAKDINNARNGWNLLSNPYPQPIRVRSFLNQNPTLASVGVWNGSSYVYYNRNSNGGNDWLPAAQGFFINVANTVDVSFDNSNRTTASNSLMRVAQDTTVGEISLSLNGVDKTSLFFDFDALVSNGFDASRDAYKLLTAGVSEIYTIAENNEIALNSFVNDGNEKVIPVGVTISSLGAYTIAATTNTSDYAQVLLKDNVTGTITDLTTSSYTFIATTTGKLADRFVIQLPESRLTGITSNNSVATSVNVFDNGNRSLTVNGNVDVIRVVNLSGTEIYNGSSLNISVPSSGLYLIETLSNDSKTTHKVFVK